MFPEEGTFLHFIATKAKSSGVFGVAITVSSWAFWVRFSDSTGFLLSIRVSS